MSSHNLLRKQVISEVKKKRLIFLTFVVLSFIYLSISLVFGDMGLFRYLELNRTKMNIAEPDHRDKQTKRAAQDTIKTSQGRPFLPGKARQRGIRTVQAQRIYLSV